VCGLGGSFGPPVVVTRGQRSSSWSNKGADSAIDQYRSIAPWSWK